MIFKVIGEKWLNFKKVSRSQFEIDLVFEASFCCTRRGKTVILVAATKHIALLHNEVHFR